jgi:hypothetical protein
MGLDGPRNQFDGELAALQSRREMESLSTSSVFPVMSEIADVAGEFGVPGAGLFAKALKSGQTPVEKVVEQIEKGAYAEIARIWKHLEGQDTKLTEFNERLQIQEAKNAYLSAVLHGLRTSDPKKQSCLGALTVNCIYLNDLKPESLDDTMRAAIELKREDVIILGNLYEWQNQILSERGMTPQKWHGDIQQAQRRLIDSRVLNATEHLTYKSSYARLEALGLIQRETSAGDYGVGYELYVLLMEGKKFYERLQEVGATK